MAISGTEAALEGQRIGALQIRVAAICFLAQTFDGFDLNSIGMAAPALSQAWHLPGAAFAITFVMSSVGIMVGALVSGPVGDRVGPEAGAAGQPGAADRLVLRLRLGRVHPGTGRAALRHRPGHRHPDARQRGAGVRLRAGAAPRRHDHGGVHRRAAGGLRRRPTGGTASAGLRLDVDFHRRRHAAAAADPGRAVLAAGITALPAEERPPDRRHAAVAAPAGASIRSRPATRWTSPAAIRSPGCSATGSR